MRTGPARRTEGGPGSLRQLVVTAALKLATLAGTQALAAELPLWEAGAGVATLSFPDYRGSDERRLYLLPMPYLVYRGDLIKADREGVRGQFFDIDRVRLDLSANASVPVDSSANSARAGMPDLAPTVEIGPSVQFRLLGSPDKDVELDLRLPVRAVIALGPSRIHDVGWVFQPLLNVDFRDSLPGGGWNLGIAFGPLYGDRRYHSYYYDVAPEFATASRPTYAASGGYSGMQLTAAISKRFPSFWVGAFARMDALADATFEPSPLVRQTQSFSAGMGIAWILSHSDRTVEARE
jgi:MipA family protein